MGSWNICFYNDFVMSLYFNSGGKFTFDGEVKSDVTHWMPFPKAPKERK
jgi:hypothetical protein